MAAIPDAKLSIVRRVVATAPDSVLRDLSAVLSGVFEDGLQAIAALVREEIADRALRSAVMAPVLGTGAVVTMQVARFPSAKLGLVWDALRRREAEMLAHAREVFAEHDGYGPMPFVFDQLCLAAAAAIRDEPKLAAALDQDAASVLEAAPLVRYALDRAPSWTGRAGPDEAVVLRLILKDAAAMAEDGVPRFLNLLATHMEERSRVLRFVSSALERPTDTFLAGSELAGFGEVLLDDIAAEIERVKSYDPALGADSGRAAARLVQRVCNRMHEFEASLELYRDGPWGRRVTEFRRSLAAIVEGRLRDLDQVLQAALPMQTVRLGGRMRRTSPKLDAPLDPRRVEPARSLMTFLDGVRMAGAAGGFGSVRAKTAERVAERLLAYADEALTAVHAHEAADEALALEHVALAADFLELTDDPREAATVRRRVNAAALISPSRQRA